jgi:threonine aldolase
MRVHIDGARIFNAAVALGTPASALAAGADSVSFCLSKGLSAPVGSVLCSSRDTINRARKWRKMLGGGMRQSGVIAAAGIVALETMIDRLAEDHSSALRLARGIARIPGLTVAGEPQTNIVMFEVIRDVPGVEFARRAEASGVKVGHRGGQVFRAVTNRMATGADIDLALEQLAGCLRQQ